jgi:hypothetical protein
MLKASSVFCPLTTGFSSSHIERSIYGDPFDGSYNITGPQMVLVMKLTTFAWNVWDGRRPVEVRYLPLQPTTNFIQCVCVGSRQVADEGASYKIPLVA